MTLSVLCDIPGSKEDGSPKPHEENGTHEGQGGVPQVMEQPPPQDERQPGFIEGSGEDDIAVVIGGSIGYGTSPAKIGASVGTFTDFEALLQLRKYKEAKQFVRENKWPVTHPIRQQLWLRLCRMQAQEKTDVDGYYWDAVKHMIDPEVPLHLASFVDPTHLSTYHLTAKGRKVVERVVCVISHSYPAITYAPTIYSLTCLLLHFMSEEECFNSLCWLLSWTHGKFIIQTKQAYETSWRTVMQLTKKFAKAAYGNLGKYLKNSETEEQIFEQWLWWIFDYLPFSHVVRVMDCFLFEGSKVLYRVAMAILILFQKHTAKGDTFWAKEAVANGLGEVLIKFCQQIPVSPDKLLKVAFGIRALSQSEVGRIVLRTEMYLKSRTQMSNNSMAPFVRSRSTQDLPTSQSELGMQSTSQTLTIHQLLLLWTWMPARITMYQPKLVYTTQEHGCSLTTFYARVDGYEPTIIVIKTLKDEIFGAYCSKSWCERNSKDESGQRHTYFGTGETFLFSMHPHSQKYPWVGLLQEDNKPLASVKHSAELFMAADSKMITIGGGGGQGILLDGELRFGSTEACDTFKNAPLCSTNDFECKVVEVYGFTS